MVIVNFILIILLSISFPGIISITKAITAGRKAPSVFQPLYDIIRLFKKGSIYSKTTTVIFKLGAPVYFASVLTASFLIPFFGNEGIFSFRGDFVYFAYILGFGRFFMIISAMDVGSGFEGMGANREAFYSLLIEPAYFIVLGSMALITDNISFNGFFTALHFNNQLSYMVIIASVFVFVFISMIENSRLPVDDPKTHLELTMVHEVMILDNSGFDLALMHITGWIKFVIYGSIIANIIIPIQFNPVLKTVSYCILIIVFAVVTGLLESFRARNKMAKNPQWILMLSSLSVMVFLALLILTSKLVLN